MKKLLELEKRLIKAREELSESLKKFGSQGPLLDSPMSTGMSGDVNVAKKEMSEGQKKLDVDKDGKIESSDLAALRSKKKSMNKAEHPDEKEDKKLIAEAMDRHNEQKHGEKKDKDSAFKGMKKSDEVSRKKPTGPANPTEGKKQQFVDTVINQARKPAKVTNAAGEVTEVSPEQQIKAKKDSANAKKAKFEAEAAARRAKMKLNKSEEISYLENGQWSLEKARILDFPSGNLVADMGQPNQATPPAGKLRDADAPPPIPSSTEEAAVAPVSSMPKKDGARLSQDPSAEHFRGHSNTSEDFHQGYGKNPADIRRRQILSDMHVDSRSDLPDDSKWPHIKR